MTDTVGRHRKPSRYARWRFNRELRRQVHAALEEAEAEDFLALLRGADKPLPQIPPLYVTEANCTAEAYGLPQPFEERE